ncbi:hypothetical protein AB0D42_40700 [Streptomyces sp. NPDC048304]|uniref:hypothetical protein n=1 Tax=Streptomyces sp. NPDC048304 TaxID=3154820 RepID=UPI0033CA9AD6
MDDDPVPSMSGRNRALLAVAVVALSTALVLLGLYGGNGLLARIAWTIMGPLPVLVACTMAIGSARAGGRRVAEGRRRVREAEEDLERALRPSPDYGHPAPAPYPYGTAYPYGSHGTADPYGPYGPYGTAGTRPAPPADPYHPAQPQPVQPGPSYAYREPEPEPAPQPGPSGEYEPTPAQEFTGAEPEPTTPGPEDAGPEPEPADEDFLLAEPQPPPPVGPGGFGGPQPGSSVGVYPPGPAQGGSYQYVPQQPGPWWDGLYPPGAQGRPEVAGTRLTLPELWAVTHRRLDLYHEIALGQAARSFRNAQVAMVIGFLLLGGFVVVALHASTTAGSVVAGGLGAVAAALAGYVSRTFIRSQEAAAGHLRAYFHQPLESSRYLAAERLVADAALGEERRAEVLGRLVEAMVSGPGSRAPESPAPAQERGAPDGGGRP